MILHNLQYKHAVEQDIIKQITYFYIILLITYIL